jgi:hypothetical protein
LHEHFCPLKIGRLVPRRSGARFVDLHGSAGAAIECMILPKLAH